MVLFYPLLFLFETFYVVDLWNISMRPFIDLPRKKPKEFPCFWNDDYVRVVKVTDKHVQVGACSTPNTIKKIFLQGLRRQDSGTS
jgi:hypothetical protein